MSSIEHYPLGVIHPPPLPVSNDSHYLETPYAQGSSHVNWSRPFLLYPNTSPIATHSNGSADSRTAIISQDPYDQPFSDARRRSVNQRIMDAGEQGWFSFIESLWRQWNLAVNNKETWPRIVYCMGGVIFIGAWLGLMATFASSEKQYQRHDIDERPHVTANPRLAGLGVSKKCWFLEGRLQRFDPATRTLSINWVLKTVKNRRDSIIGEDLEDIMRIGIFQDQDLVPVDSNYAIVTGNATKIWDFRVANESAIPTAIVGTSQWDSFITDIAMGQRKKANAMRQPQWGFPFDLWSGDTSFVANIWDKSLNINRTDAFGIEIDGIVLVDSLMNWRISTKYNNTCSNVTEYGSLVWTAMGSCGLHVRFKARRTGLVKFACVVAVIINWFSTVFIFIMTCEGVIMRRFEVITSPQLLAVCFTALFALPSVRSILPGAPEFGSLVDLVGIVPNVIIISVCTTLVAVATLRHLVERNDQETLREPSNT
ncbi:hypothetical protein CPB86DRAFT_869219 [Serendipita vermifera]|nr:hypothetical protein CPB86DRAFT_869219 [Serendipita vermifera]